MNRSTKSPRDRGSILPMALVCSVSLSIVVAALASYVATGLRYGAVVEQRADRLAAADGGLRYSVEMIERGAAQLCGSVGGHDLDPPDLNGATVTSTCTQLGNGFESITGWAIIMTGEGVAAGSPLLSTQSGSGGEPKLVGGPVYMNRLAFDLGAPTEFRYSQLLYTSSDCNTAPVKPANLDFDSDSLGMVCTTRPWSATETNGLYKEPNRSDALVPNVTNPAPTWSYTAFGNCKVFHPGKYTSPPALDANNYFMSGNYLFDGGPGGWELEIKNAVVTAGRAVDDTSNPLLGNNGSTQFIPNKPCEAARTADPGQTVTSAGVTFYLQRRARFVVDSHGTFEILRRKQGPSYVSIHVLDNSFDATTNVILQRPGTNKDMAIHGLIWAPRARLFFQEVTNSANGQLLGGAVISNIELRSSASAKEFMIAVEPSDLTGKLQVDSTAVLDGHTTTIRSIVDYRPTTRYTATTSWRVLD